MAFLEQECGTNLGNTGLQDCLEEFGHWKKLIITGSDFEIADKATALLESTWLTAINASKATRIYPLPGNFNFEGDQEERVQEDGWAGESETVREGKDKGTFTFKDTAFYNHLKLRTHNSRRNPSMFIVTSQGYILGYSENLETGKFLPQALSDFYVNKRTISDGDTKDRSGVFVEFADAKQWNDKGVWIKPTDWDPLLLDGVKDARLSGTLAATTETITVVGASDGVGVVGLVDANFSLYDDLAPLVPIAVTAVDNGDGTYATTHASITGAHTMTLFGQPIGTAGYEAINSISTTV